MYDEDWRIYKGIEAEGRLIGLPTLFIRSSVEAYKTKTIIDDRTYIHAFFTLEYMDEYIKDKKGARDLLEYALNKSDIVTIQVTLFHLSELSFSVLNRCHVMLVLHIGEKNYLRKLKVHDTIALVDGDHSVHTIQAGNLIPAEAHYYNSDIALLKKRKNE